MRPSHDRIRAGRGRDPTSTVATAALLRRKRIAGGGARCGDVAPADRGGHAQARHQRRRRFQRLRPAFHPAHRRARRRHRRAREPAAVALLAAEPFSAGLENDRHDLRPRGRGHHQRGAVCGGRSLPRCGARGPADCVWHSAARLPDLPPGWLWIGGVAPVLDGFSEMDGPSRDVAAYGGDGAARGETAGGAGEFDLAGFDRARRRNASGRATVYHAGRCGDDSPVGHGTAGDDHSVGTLFTRHGPDAAEPAALHAGGLLPRGRRRIEAACAGVSSALWFAARGHGHRHRAGLRLLHVVHRRERRHHSRAGWLAHAGAGAGEVFGSQRARVGHRRGFARTAVSAVPAADSLRGHRSTRRAGTTTARGHGDARCFHQQAVPRRHCAWLRARGVDGVVGNSRRTEGQGVAAGV